MKNNNLRPRYGLTGTDFTKEQHSASDKKRR